MIKLNEALKIVLNSATPLPSEQVEMAEAAGRVLSADVTSDIEMPPFNKSAMDGYACRREDLPNPLQVLETIPAGSAPTKIIGKNQCSKIMTGAPVPNGADCVVMFEYTEACGDNAIRFTGNRTKTNICSRGEDTKTGDVVIRSGTLIQNRHIPVLASVGCTNPTVARRPKVAVIATGDELVEPSCAPGNSQIRNSNAHQLRAQIKSIGAIPVYYGIAKDREDSLRPIIKKASAECDVILLSGGVSTGDFDLVRAVLQQEQFTLLFETIASKPGKPTVFGKADNCFCFGLPGNPVSTYILFENLVKPFLFKLMGHDYKHQDVPMRLGCSIQHKRGNRDSWIPVKITEPGVIKPIEYHGSAHLKALADADGLICLPMETLELAEGATIAFRQF